MLGIQSHVHCALLCFQVMMMIMRIKTKDDDDDDEEEDCKYLIDKSY